MFNFKTIKSRILSISFLPISALLVISAYVLIDQYSRLNDLAKIEELTEVILQGNILVHELQKERGRTSGFFNSKGLKFTDELTKQRSLSDKEKKHYEEHLNEIKSSHFSKNVIDNVEEMKKNLVKLEAIRNSVNEFTGVVDDYLKYYTQTISKILKITRDLNELMKENYQMARTLNSYYNLLEYKERIGITRATYAGVFSNNAFTKNLYKRAIEINIESNEFLKNYNYYSTPEQIAFYKSTVSGEDIDKTDELMKFALSHSDTVSLGVNPSTWFDAITGKIEKLKKVEDKASKDLIELTKQFHDKALMNIMLTLIFSIAIIAFLIFYTIYHSNKIVKPIKYAAYLATEISKGHLDI